MRIIFIDNSINFTSSSLILKALDSLQKILINFSSELSRKNHEVVFYNKTENEKIEEGVSWKKIDKQQTSRLAETEAILSKFVGQLDGVGETIGKKVEAGWLHVTDTMHAKHADQAAQLNAMLTHNRDEITAIAVDSESTRINTIQQFCIDLC